MYIDSNGHCLYFTKDRASPTKGGFPGHNGSGGLRSLDLRFRRPLRYPDYATDPCNG